MTEFFDDICSARLKLQMSQKELCKKLKNFSEGKYQRLERGVIRKPIDIESLKQISETLNLDFVKLKAKMNDFVDRHTFKMRRRITYNTHPKPQLYDAKPCPICGKDTPTRAYKVSYCLDCHRVYQKIYRMKNKDV